MRVQDLHSQVSTSPSTGFFSMGLILLAINLNLVPSKDFMEPLNLLRYEARWVHTLFRIFSDNILIIFRVLPLQFETPTAFARPISTASPRPSM
ncbi:hypothetical protein KSP39_PZI018683 [Platanthera zijinensis]|uniref:Uncharacterized protein n=1 Tax=Platanthera zijinensis TaxID=2320716 RepID=A0AAP0B4N1_9ASPA